MKEAFSRYQIFVVVVLAFLQFTVVLDFMILSPLGALLIEKLNVTPSQFGNVVSAYAFSAGLSGLLAAGFADRFDRRSLLLFFYCGFIVGTGLCGLATTYRQLFGARVVTGLFGGVIGSISFAIIADLFPISMRGRVMGLVQTSFAAAQILGLPIGLYLANQWGWHAPFFLIVAVSIVAGIFMFTNLKPVTEHLTLQQARNPFVHLFKAATRPRHLAGFAATMLMATGGFMLMPFGSTFLVQNIKIPLDRLPLIYMVTGVSAMISGPLLGRAADAFGKYRVFVLGTLLGAVLIVFYTRLEAATIGVVLALNVGIFISISARMVSTFAITSGLPDPPDRGAYMSISSSLQQFSGGVAASAAGLIVHQSTPTSPLERYPTLGLVVGSTMFATIFVMGNVNRIVRRNST